MKLTFETFARFGKSRRWFTWYFGVGIPPALIGTVVAGYRISPWVGVGVVVVMVAWSLELFRSSCSRCRFYGTTKCGLPGMIAPLIVKPKSRHTISLRHVRFNLSLDVAMIVFVNAVYAIGWPTVWPVIAVCTVGGWLTVFRRKRFHGLLYRLREGTHEQGVAVSISTRPDMRV